MSDSRDGSDSNGDGPSDDANGDGPSDDANEDGPSDDANEDGPSDDPESNGMGNHQQSDGGLPRLDRYFDALSDRRRRYLLYYLQRHGSASEEELARHVVAEETGRPAADLSADEYERAQSSLHHKHLPRLADYGLVEFDPRSKTARFGEPTRTFATLLWLSQLVENER